tara:strand:- start:1700 stop:1987 length:288 start_codon:yes stop_codon:yes gene_type:complete
MKNFKLQIQNSKNQNQLRNVISVLSTFDGHHAHNLHINLKSAFNMMDVETLSEMKSAMLHTLSNFESTFIDSDLIDILEFATIQMKNVTDLEKQS